MNLRSRVVEDRPQASLQRPSRPQNGTRSLKTPNRSKPARPRREAHDNISKRPRKTANGQTSKARRGPQAARYILVNGDGLQTSQGTPLGQSLQKSGANPKEPQGSRAPRQPPVQSDRDSPFSPGQRLNAGHSLKRPASGAVDATSPTQAKRTKLTSKNLRLHTAAETPSEMTKRTRSGPRSGTSRTTTAHAQFGQQLSENGIVYKQSRVKQPEDLEAIKFELEKTRASGSPSSEDWHLYQRRFDDATNEDSMRHFAWSKLAKEPGLGGKHYIPVIHQEWTEIETTQINRNLSNPKPDHFESLSIDCYPQSAREALKGHLQPSSYDWSMPRYAAEFKSQSGSETQAERQAAYDGAIMVDAARAQEEHLDRPFQYGHTQALTVTSKGDMVRIFANHAVQDKQETRFHHVQVLYGDPLSSRADFSATRRRVRNAQDWARSRAEETCDDLNEHDNRQSRAKPSSKSQPRKRARKATS